MKTEFLLARPERIWLLPAAVLLVAGCASTIEPVAPSINQRAAAATFKAGLEELPDFDPGWWSAFDDPALARLVGRALEVNPDIRLALERIDQARAGTTAAASRSAPTVAANGSVSRSSSGLPDDVKRGLPDVRAVRGSIDLSWEIDVFGGARAARDAAAWDLQAADAGAQAARLLIAAEVARHYFSWQGARARLVRLEQLLSLQSALERLTRSRHAAGHASQFDVINAAGETQTLASQLPPLRSLIAVSENQMAALLALLPGDMPGWLPADDPPRLREVPPMGAGQPLDLLRRRPDLMAAGFAIAAESARLKESQADLLPKFFAAALFGVQDLDINGRDLRPVGYNNLALAFSMPLFNRGRLRAQAERQASRQRSSVLQYEKSVLAALGEVESSLEAMRQERMRLVQLRDAQGLRATGVRHAQSLYREGQISQLQLIDAQRAFVAAELATVDSQTQQVLSAVQLYKALGGGWLADPPVATSSGDAPAAPVQSISRETP